MKRNQPTKRLTLDKSTIRTLTAPQLHDARGGAEIASVTLTLIIISLRVQCTATLDTVTDGCGPTLSA